MIRIETLSTAPWRGDAVEPHELRAVLKAGHLAPSVHNTQPWRFILTNLGIEVHTDPGRSLRRLDPDGRELVISCGAAIMNMRVASAAIGRKLRVQLLPDTADRTHLATLTFGSRSRSPLPGAELMSAIERRHTYRRGFDAGTIASSTLATLADQAEQEGTELVRLDERRRRGVARLTRIAEMTLASDPAYRRELRAWTSSRSRATEGVPVSGFGTQPQFGGPPLRDYTIAMPWLKRAVQHFRDEEWLVLLTNSDDVENWIAAGQAVERVLLAATTAGLGASFMTQAFEVPALRADFARTLGTCRQPQLLLRMGPAAAVAAAGRRPLDQVVTVGNGAAHLLLDHFAN